MTDTIQDRLRERDDDSDFRDLCGLIDEAADHIDKLEKRTEFYLSELKRLEDFEDAHEWQPIETAPKDDLVRIILGFSPDEEDWTLPSVEGYWRPNQYKDAPPCFVSCMDPDVPYDPPQPTHWMPLPTPPEENRKTENETTDHRPR